VNQREQQERFDLWLKEHGAILHHVVNGFAWGDDRNDLMQELLLALWKAVPAFRADSKASTFIFRVSHNTALTWHRTAKNYRRKVERFEALVPADVCSVPVPPDAELLEQVYVEIRLLPAVDRSLILLSLDGVAYREMAEIHGLTESNVGVRLNRAKQQLAKAMKAKAHDLR
jgi:RNA polymerase sigma-70 factor (ECF subfamily)